MSLFLKSACGGAKTIIFMGCLSRASLLVMSSFVLSPNVQAQQTIKVSQPAWVALAPNERSAIQKVYIVELAEQDNFGVIIDNQGVNESTYGTNAGADLGGAVANAAYIDKAIKSGNYSAKNQLATGILGALLGSVLDSKPNAQFHFRYAVKLGSGNIAYFDEIKNDAFRHPVGVCVSVPNIALIEQQLCSQSAASLRMAYLGIRETQAVSAIPVSTATKNESAHLQTVNPADGSLTVQVNCKLGTLAPVRTSAEKCELIKGSQVP